MSRKQLDVAALHAALDVVRAHRDWTWREVAADTGLSASTLTRLGQGHKPDADALCTLIVWLRSPLAHFVTDVPREDA